MNHVEELLASSQAAMTLALAMSILAREVNLQQGRPLPPWVLERERGILHLIEAYKTARKGTPDGKPS